MASGKGHILLRVAQGVVITLVLIQLAVCIVLQIPYAQTYAVRTVTELAGDKINGDISIGKISLVFFNRLSLKDVTVCGHGAPAPWGDSDTCLFHNPGDTLGHVGKLTVTLAVRDFLEGKIGARRVSLEDSFFYLLTEGDDGRSNLTRIFNLPLPDPDKVNPVFPDIFTNDVKLKNCGFTLGNPYAKAIEKAGPEQMLYNNLQIKNICAHFKDFKTINGEINCRILSLSATERSGAEIRNMTGKLHLGPRGSGMDDMHLEALTGTVLNAEHLYFKYSSKEEIADWVNSVVMDVKFGETTFDFNSLRHFVPSMSTNHLMLTIKGGEVTGPVSDMVARGLKVSPTGTLTSVSVDAELRGIPDMPNTYLEGKLTDVLYSGDLAVIISGWSGKPAPEAVSSLPKDRTIYQNVSFKGPFKDLGIYGTLKLDAGLLTHDVYVSLFTPAGIVVGGTLDADSLDLGYALNTELLGETDFKLKGELQIDKELDARVEYFNIDRMGILGYDYRNMAFSGETSDSECHAVFVSRDSNFRTDIGFDIFLTGENKTSGRYSLLLDAPYVDFRKLNLITESGRSILTDMKLQMDVDFDGTENAIGRLKVKDLSYANARGVISLDSLSIVSYGDSTGYGVDLRSPYADITYRGKEPMMASVLRAKDIAFDRQFGEVFGVREDKTQEDVCPGTDTLTLRTHDTWKVLNVITEGLYLADGSNLLMTLSDRDSLALEFNSGRLAQNGTYVKDLCLKIDAPDSIVRMNITGSEIRAGNMALADNKIDISAEKGLINVGCTFLNGNVDDDRTMSLAADVSFSKDENGYLTTGISLDSAVVFVDANKWMADSTEAVIGNHLIKIDGFNFHGHTASLKIDGTVSDNPEDRMIIDLDSLDLSLANAFLTGDMALCGNVTGHISVGDIFNNSNFAVDIEGRDISVAENPLGLLQIMSKWDPVNERMNLFIDSRYQERAPINMTGYYKHADRDLYVNASLEELSLAYAKPFLKDILRIDGGDLSGNIIFRGTNGKYSINSENTRFRNFAFTPVYTEVPYLMNGGVKFTENRIDMDGVEIEDRNGNKAVLTGGIKHHFLNDMDLDIRLIFRDLECVDIKEKPGASFYGTASASGSVAVTGPLNNILIDAVVRTGDNTSIKVPLSNAYAASSNDILVFKEYRKGPVDPYDSLMTAGPAVIRETGKLRIKADATLYDDALVTIELDKSLGNIVECHGNARVNLDIDPVLSTTDIRGEYTISSGLARYSFAGIIARDFSLQEGGTLTFRGPLEATHLDVGATYHTKTSLSTLVADTSSTGTRQNVYASVGLKGDLTNPTFNFKFDIPDLDPLTRGRVETAFSTEAKVQKQFMALMLTGSFLPDEQSGVSENSNILYSNVSEMISNHFNNILRTLDVPLDVGLNYQKNSRQDNMIDVNLSYQAFNNRLILNGSVGNGSRNQSWVGNFEAELKMDKRGKFRFSLFTRAADQYTNFIDNSQRTGFGFSFQDEFTNFGEIFQSRKKKEAKELEKIEQIRKELLEESALTEEKKEGEE